MRHSQLFEVFVRERLAAGVPGLPDRLLLRSQGPHQGRAAGCWEQSMVVGLTRVLNERNRVCMRIRLLMAGYC